MTWDPKTLVITDRRGQKKEPVVRPETLLAPAVDPNVDRSHWTDVSYMIAVVMTPNGPLVCGKCVGLRSDGLACMADWLFAPRWPEGYQWEKYIKTRLDTYLNCACVVGTPCIDHTRYFQQWQQADVTRLNLDAQQPLPPSMEAFMKIEMSKRQSGIVAPGR